MTSRLQTFETEMLAEEENFAGLARVNRELIGKTEAVDSPPRVVLDMNFNRDSGVRTARAERLNGNFASTYYHPLVLFNGEGDCLAARFATWQRTQR